MTVHNHNFVETYEGLVGFGLNRKTNENTVKYYLQKFSDDQVLKIITQRLTDEELDEIFGMISRLLRFHLTESEYHRLFLKDDHP
jgi:hypothetical protein